MLPLSWRGRIVLPPAAGDDPERVLDRLVVALTEHRAREVRREPKVVTFEGSMFRFVSNWNPLVTISFGRLEVERGSEGLEVRYHITFEFVVAFATFAVAFLVVWLHFLPGPDTWEVRYAFPLVVWMFLVGGSVAIDLVRFPAFVRRWSAGEGTGPLH
jgi:hypothetical protein